MANGHPPVAQTPLAIEEIFETYREDLEEITEGLRKTLHKVIAVSVGA